MRWGFFIYFFLNRNVQSKHFRQLAYNSEIYAMRILYIYKKQPRKEKRIYTFLKMNPKRHNQITHKVAVLANLMTGALDEIGANSKLALDFKKKCEELLPFCERIIDDTYQAQQIRSTTYLSEVSNKVDTVIRKSYQKITK